MRMMQQQLQKATTVKKRAKTVYSQRNLGTIKDRKREKREQKEGTSGEIIMRILRMRWVKKTNYPFLGVVIDCWVTFLGGPASGFE